MSRTGGFRDFLARVLAHSPNPAQAVEPRRHNDSRCRNTMRRRAGRLISHQRPVRAEHIMRIACPKVLHRKPLNVRQAPLGQTAKSQVSLGVKRSCQKNPGHRRNLTMPRLDRYVARRTSKGKVIERLSKTAVRRNTRLSYSEPLIESPVRGGYFR